MAAAARLEDTLSKVIGSEIRARPHRNDYQLLLDKQASDRPVEVLVPNAFELSSPASRSERKTASRSIRSPTCSRATLNPRWSLHVPASEQLLSAIRRSFQMIVAPSLLEAWSFECYAPWRENTMHLKGRRHQVGVGAQGEPRVLLSEQAASRRMFLPESRRRGAGVSEAVEPDSVEVSLR